jgi:hypothetical protein
MKNAEGNAIKSESQRRRCPESDLRISLISARSPSGIKMMCPSSMPQVPSAPVMGTRRLDLSCHFLSSDHIRIQQRSGFSTFGWTGQKNDHANN